MRLLPGDNIKNFKTEPHPTMPGQLMIAHKPNGDCVYLGESGCTIHEKRPRMCREMDCRIIALRIPIAMALASPRLPIAVWRRGKELLEKSND